MRISFAVLAVVTLLALPQAAQAQAFSGTTGINSAGTTGASPITGAVPAAPSTLPPVFQGADTQPQAASAPPAFPSAPTAPITPTAPVAQQPAAQPNVPAQAVPGQLDAASLPDDPCAAYLNSYNIYAACQDRVKRLERMEELKAKRTADAEARRKAIEDRKKAEEEARIQRANQPKMRRPGQVAPAPKQPQQVQIVPQEETKK